MGRTGEITSGKKHWWFPAIIVLVHVLYFLLALQYKRIYMGDTFEYVYEALNIKNCFFFYSGNAVLPIEAEYMTFRTPGYPLFLLPFYVLGFGNWCVIMMQNILSVLNILLFRKTLLAWGFNKKYDWLLLLLIIAYPAQFIHANTVEPEILLQSFVLLYVHYTVRFLKEKNLKCALLMSITLIAGLFVKPVLYPFALIHFFLLLFYAFRYRLPKISLSGVALLPILCIVLYSSGNEARTGKYHFTSNQSFNSIYYFYFFKNKTEGVTPAQNFLADERARIASIKDFSGRYDYANDRGKQLLKENLLPYSAFHLKHSARFYIEPGKADIDLFTGKLSYSQLYDPKEKGFYATVAEQGWINGSVAFAKKNPVLILVLVVLLFNLVKLVGLFFFMFDKKLPVVVKWFLFLFIAYFALLSGPITTPRYVLPVSLIYIGCAAMGWQYLSKRKKFSRPTPAPPGRGADFVCL